MLLTTYRTTDTPWLNQKLRTARSFTIRKWSKSELNAGILKYVLLNKGGRPAGKENSKTMENNSLQHDVLTGSGTTFVPLCSHSGTETSGIYEENGIINVHVTVHRDKFLFNKTNRRNNFSDLFLSRNSTCFEQRNCPKHVEFLDKNKFWKLVSLLVLLKRNLYCLI